MFEASVLDGVPYLSYVPRPLVPSLSPEQYRRFRQLDNQWKASVSDVGFVDVAADTVLLTNLASDGRSRERCVEAVGHSLGLRRLEKTQLVLLNSELTASLVQSYRTTPIWMGATHPAHAWFVGSPPSRLNRLMEGVFDLARANQPVSFRALVSLMRLLNIHPFVDGNGRTARLYSIWLVNRYLGPSHLFLSLLQSLWTTPSFSLNGAGVAVRDSNDWSLLFDFCFETLASPPLRTTSH